jgi:hypothetical protein
MVYSDPSNDIQFSALGSGVEPPRVIIYYNNSGIHEIAGPVPFIKMSETSNSAENGELFSSKLSITLEGKVVETGKAGGISGIINRISSLRHLFYGSGYDSRQYYNNALKITCDGTNTFEVSGLKILSFNASQTPDNWTLSAGYSVDLEAYIPRLKNKLHIKSASEDWTIEPLENRAYYVNEKIYTSGRPEYHNPKLGNRNPPPHSGELITLSLVDLPQYKISRTLKAVGFSSGIGKDSSFSAYEMAQYWVKSRINLAYSGADTSYPRMDFTYLNDKNSSKQYYLYNHLRNTSFSVDAGSYEINDTWLALPTGIAFVEDYTVDCSTDNKNIKTVRVQGTVKGLTLANESFERASTFDYAIPVTGSNNIYLYSGMIAEPKGIYGSTLGINVQKLDDFDSQSALHDINQHKYLNALSGWLYDIKPFLYRRACIVVDSRDRNESNYPYNLYTSPLVITRPNPIFSHERLLNINPVRYNEDHDPRKGIITYTCEFSNRFTYLSGVLSESIRINDNGPADVINEAFVLGRRLGPALQNLGSRTSSKKDLAIEITVMPPLSIGGFVLNNKECPIYTGGPIYSGISGLISDFKPFSLTRSGSLFGGGTVNTSGTAYLSADSSTWDPIQGRYTRNVSWIYQHCKLVYNNLDS